GADSSRRGACSTPLARRSTSRHGARRVDRGWVVERRRERQRKRRRSRGSQRRTGDESQCSSGECGRLETAPPGARTEAPHIAGDTRGMDRMLTAPFLQELAPAQNVLVAGIGGGFDVFSGLPLYFGLQQAGKHVHLANLSFSSLPPEPAARLAPALLRVSTA